VSSLLAMVVGLAQAVRRRAGEVEAANQSIQEEILERRRGVAQYRGFMESSRDGPVIVARDGQIQLMNDQTEHLFGYRREELVGNPVEMLLPEALRVAHRAHRAGYVAHSRTRVMGTGLHLIGRGRDRFEFPIEVSLSPVMLGDGMLVISAVRDNSDRVETEAEAPRRFPERGLAGFLHKPYTLEALITIMPDCLGPGGGEPSEESIWRPS